MASLGTTRVGFEQLGENTIKPIGFAGSTNSSYSSSVTGTFTLNLRPRGNKLGSERLATTNLGRTDSFGANSSTSFGLSGRFLLENAIQSTSNIDFTTVGIFVIDFDSNSVSNFSFSLSEDSYEELYGETLGTADKQIVVLANAEID